jgi:hypothetical protein
MSDHVVARREVRRDRSSPSVVRSDEIVCHLCMRSVPYSYSDREQDRRLNLPNFPGRCQISRHLR